MGQGYTQFFGDDFGIATLEKHHRISYRLNCTCHRFALPRASDCPTRSYPILKTQMHPVEQIGNASPGQARDSQPVSILKEVGLSSNTDVPVQGGNIEQRCLPGI